MASETMLERFFNYIPISIFSARPQTAFTKALIYVTCAFLVAVAVDAVFFDVRREIVDFQTFLVVISSVSYLAVVVADVFIILIPTHSSGTVLSALIGSDESHAERQSAYKFDPILTLCIGYAILIVSALYEHWIHLFVLAYCFRIILLFHLMVIKLAILKRADMMVTLFGQDQDRQAVVDKLRFIQMCNSKTNQVYSLPFTLWLMAGFVVFLRSMAGYWIQFGLHFDCQCLENVHPVASLFSQIQMMWLSLALAVVTTNLQNCVSITN